MGNKWEEYQKTKDTPEEFVPQPLLIGEPVAWSDISQEDNIKQWVWENYIAKGYVTLLSALWKAGKSTLLRCLFVAMAKGEEFAGQPTVKSKVLVLSEETKGDWSDRREDVEEEFIKNILIWSRPLRIKPNMKQWVAMTEEIALKCKEEEIDLIVIDTLSSFWPIDNENDSAQVLKALVPLYNFTENNVAVLLIHHFRKGGGDQAQASRGSGALPGFVDNIIEFTRKEDGFPTQRVLKTYGRFDDVVPSVVVDLQPDGTYKTLGQPWEVSKSARVDKIAEIFKSSKDPLSIKEVFNLLTKAGINITLRSVQNYIKDMIFKNTLSSVKSEVVGKKLTQFYALKGTIKQELLDIKLTDENGLPPAKEAFRFFSRTDESPSESLSSVNPQIVPVTKETKGTSVEEEPVWEDPRIQH